MTTTINAEKAESFILAPFTTLIKLLSSSAAQALTRDLAGLEQRMNAMQGTITSQAAATAASFDAIEKSIDRIQETLGKLEEALDGVGRSVEEAKSKLDESMGLLGQTFFSIITGIVSGVLTLGITKLFAVLAGLKAPRIVGTSVAGGPSTSQANLQALPPGKRSGGGKSGKAGMIGMATLMVGGLLAYAGDAFAATSATEGLSGAVDSLSGSTGSLNSSLVGSAGEALDLSGAADMLMNAMLMGAPIMQGLGMAIGGVGTALRVVSAIFAANPIGAILTVIATVAGLIIANWDKIPPMFAGVVEKIKTAFAGIKEFLLGLIPDWLKDLLGIDGGKGLEATLSEAKENIGKAISEKLPSAEGILNGLSEAGQTVKDFGGGLMEKAGNLFGGWFGGSAAEGVSPAAVAGPVDNSSETNVTVGQVTVQTQATDAQGIANDFNRALERSMTAARNTGVPTS